MATRTELAEKVLQKLGVTHSGATADNDDITLIRDKYDSFYENLKAQDLVSWASTDDIPDTHLIPIVGLLARECLEDFTASPMISQMLILDEDRYLNQLRALEYQYYVPTDEARYF